MNNDVSIVMDPKAAETGAMHCLSLPDLET